MHRDDLLIYRHKLSGEVLRLVKTRESNINTFIQVDAKGDTIIEKRCWSTRPYEQLRLIKGFDNLELIEKHNNIN